MFGPYYEDYDAQLRLGMSIRQKFKQFLGIHNSSASESRTLSRTSAPVNQASRSAPNIVAATVQVSRQSEGSSPQPSETPTIEPDSLPAAKVLTTGTPSSSPAPAPLTPLVLPAPAEVVTEIVSMAPDQKTTETTTIALVADKADEVIAANAAETAADEKGK